MMRKFKRALALAMALAMAVSVIPGNAYAAKKAVKLDKKQVGIKIGEKAKVSVKYGQQKSVVTWKSNNAIAKIKSKKTAGNKAYAIVVGVKAGKCDLVASYKVNKKAKKAKKLVCKVNVVQEDAPAITDAPVVTNPAVNVPVVTAPPATVPTSNVTANPTSEPEPTKEASNMIPIQEFLDDEDYECPAGYSDVIAANAGTMVNIEYPSTVIIEGEEVMRKAIVALPKDYDPDDDTRYPVIFCNHGIGGDETSMAGDVIKNILWNAVEAGTAEPAIIVFGSGCANEYNGTGNVYPFFSLEHYAGYDNFLNDVRECLKPYIDENFKTKPERDFTAICGFSMGGRVTLHQGFAAQDLYRYVGAFCPAPGIFDFEDQGVSGQGLFTKDEFKINDEYIGNTLVLLARGKSDTTVHKFPVEYHDALVENEVPHIYLEYNGGHDGSVYHPAFYNFVRRIFKENK